MCRSMRAKRTRRRRPVRLVLNQVWTVAHGFGDDNRAIDRFAARLGDYEARLSTYFGT